MEGAGGRPGRRKKEEEGRRMDGRGRKGRTNRNGRRKNRMNGRMKGGPDERGWKKVSTREGLRSGAQGLRVGVRHRS